MVRPQSKLGLTSKWAISAKGICPTESLLQRKTNSNPEAVRAHQHREISPSRQLIGSTKPALDLPEGGS